MFFRPSVIELTLQNEENENVFKKFILAIVALLWPSYYLTFFADFWCGTLLGRFLSDLGLWAFLPYFNLTFSMVGARLSKGDVSQKLVKQTQPVLIVDDQADPPTYERMKRKREASAPESSENSPSPPK